MVDGGYPLLPEIFNQSDPPLRKRRRKTLRKSLIVTNRTSTARFPMSLRWTSYGAPKPLSIQKGGRKRKMADSGIKVDFYSKHLCYKFSLCENFHRHSCKPFTHFTGLSDRAQMVGGGAPSTWHSHGLFAIAKLLVKKVLNIMAPICLIFFRLWTENLTPFLYSLSYVVDKSHKWQKLCRLNVL